jgi:hypothetical protein
VDGLNSETGNIIHKVWQEVECKCWATSRRDVNAHSTPVILEKADLMQLVMTSFDGRINCAMLGAKIGYTSRGLDPPRGRGQGILRKREKGGEKASLPLSFCDGMATIKGRAILT